MFTNVVDDALATHDANAAESGLGVRLPSDRWEGDTNMRTLQKLLAMVDARGFERSPHQLSFHAAFVRACSRVIYRDDWALDRPQIMKANDWDKCSSEVMISTPRYARAALLRVLVAHSVAVLLFCRTGASARHFRERGVASCRARGLFHFVERC